MTPDQLNRLERVEAILVSLSATERYTIQKHLQMFDGRNVILGKTTGTKIGTQTTQKVGFFGVTPVIQQAAIGAPSSAASPYNQAAAQTAVDAINLIRTTLTNLGLTA